jgi:hypothetical protein
MDELNHFVSVGQCVYFVTLVIMQLFGNLFASRTRRLSVLQKNPFWGPSKNWRIPIAMCISIAIVAFVSIILASTPVQRIFYSLCFIRFFMFHSSTILSKQHPFLLNSGSSQSLWPLECSSWTRSASS